MSNSADVRSVEALDRLRGALKACEGGVREALTAAERGVHEAEEWIRDRINYWTAQGRYREVAVEEAERSLAACLASGDDEHPPSCGAEESALYAARLRLQEAQEALTLAFRWQRQIEEAAIAYRQEAQRLSHSMAESAAGGASVLDKSAGDLQSYISRTSGVGSLASAIGGPAPGGAGIGGSLGGGRGAGGWTAPASSMPAGSVQLGTRRLGAFSLSQITPSQLGLRSAADFHKVSYSTVVSGLHRLHETVMPAVNRGLGADYFKSLDAQKGLSGDDSYFAVYDSYYSEGKGIRLDWTGSGWDIVNGHHRVAAAMWEGYTDLPAFIRGER